MKLIDILKEILDEEIRQKGVLSKGGHKFAYPVSKAYKDSSISGEFVVKTWKDKDTVDAAIKREYDIYSKNKDMFAPISKMDFKRRIMVQKKLDIGKAQSELQKLKKYLKSYYEDYPDVVLQDLPQFFEVLAEDEELAKKIRGEIKDSSVASSYDRWLQFVIDMNNMDKSYVDRFGKDRSLVADLHDGNVGYDDDGKLKFLDI